MTQPAPANQLYFGDNLNILRDYVADESVDLIYLDPPFNSNATYNVLFREREGDESAAQIAAFEDTWHWSLDSELAYQEVVTQGAGKVADLLAAMRSFLGQNDMMAYLTMMTQRMIELHRVLKPTGSIYLHCDPTASHYLKLLMDAVFGATNFRNEIVWKRTRSESEYWLTSLPGQAAVDGGQLFLLVDDAHSGRLCAWDVVPNRCGGHSTRSVSRVAHAHPGASRPQRNSLSRLWPVQISDHSPWTLSKPRSRNCRKPRPALIWPKTGPTVAMRRA